MRQVIDSQLQFGEQDISAIKLDSKSRDDIPRILRELQHIYITPEVLPPQEDGEGKVSADTGG